MYALCNDCSTSCSRPTYYSLIYPSVLRFTCFVLLFLFHFHFQDCTDTVHCVHSEPVYSGRYYSFKFQNQQCNIAKCCIVLYRIVSFRFVSSKYLVRRWAKKEKKRRMRQMQLLRTVYASCQSLRFSYSFY